MKLWNCGDNHKLRKREGAFTTVVSHVSKADLNISYMLTANQTMK